MHRVPAYFLGLYLGKMSWEGKECDKKCEVLVWVSFFISILLLVYMRFEPLTLEMYLFCAFDSMEFY